MLQVVLDKQLHILSLFRVSGMKGMAYWVATFFSDLPLFFLTAFLILGCGLGFGHSPFIKVIPHFLYTSHVLILH